MTDPRAPGTTSSSPNDSAARQCAELLEGIDLSPALLARVRSIVTADAVARRELVVHHPQRFWDQIAMIATRDASIRALLESDAQRTAFDANVERWNRIRTGGAER